MFIKFYFQSFLQGQIDWEIDDFSKWVAGKGYGWSHKSSVFTFKFPQVQKDFNFALTFASVLVGERLRDRRFIFGVNLSNENSESLKIEVEFSLFIQTGARSVPNSNPNPFTFRPNSQCEKEIQLFEVDEIRNNPDNCLVEGRLHVRCNFTINWPKITKVNVETGLKIVFRPFFCIF